MSLSTYSKDFTLNIHTCLFGYKQDTEFLFLKTSKKAICLHWLHKPYLFNPPSPKLSTVLFIVYLFPIFPDRLKEKKKPVLQVTNAHSRDQSHGPEQQALAESSSARGQSRWPPESFTTLTILPFCLILLLWWQELTETKQHCKKSLEESKSFK